MAPGDDPDSLLHEARIANCDFRRAQEGQDGFHLIGSVYFNRATVTFGDGREISFHLKSCEIVLTCQNYELDTTTLAFGIQGSDSRMFKLGDERALERQDTRHLSADLSAETNGGAGTSLTRLFNLKGKAAQKHDVRQTAKASTAMEDEKRPHRYTRLTRKTANEARWTIDPDPFWSEDPTSPKNIIAGERMKSDEELAYVRKGTEAPDVWVSVCFRSKDMAWVEPDPEGWWAELCRAAPRPVGAPLRRLTDPSSKEALVARLKLAKHIRKNILLAKL